MFAINHTKNEHSINKDSRSRNNSWFVTNSMKVQYFCWWNVAILIFHKICDLDHLHPEPCLGSYGWHSTFQLEENVSSNHIFSLFKTFPEDLTIIGPLPWLLVSSSIVVLCSLVSWFFPLSPLAHIDLQSWGCLKSQEGEESGRRRKGEASDRAALRLLRFGAQVTVPALPSPSPLRQSLPPKAWPLVSRAIYFNQDLLPQSCFP